MRALRTIPVMLDFARTDGGGLPGRSLPQLHQPDGDALHGDEPGDGDPAPSVSATACTTRPRTSPTGSTSPSRRSTSSAPVSTTSPSCCATSGTARTSIPPCASLPPNDASRPGNGSASSCFRRFGYFVTESSEHFSEYVPWFIKPGRDDLIQKLQHPARRVSGPLRGSDRRLGRFPRRPDVRRSRGAAPLPGGDDAAGCTAWTRGASRWSKEKILPWPRHCAKKRSRSGKRRKGSLR